ncbi:hypothetical protein H5410_000653 [Solanum commersonii]|uniref:Uncharacterized protein n=1 Tax=Solanum commersonii TaxID=4109 RepID=A0A9J6AWU2_SOLCO|nr:hypothetical protein H5410_000653 [Solanum commersonii]
MSNLSISTSSDANVFCRCRVNAELKTSWTQLNIGRRFFCCTNTKFNYFDNLCREEVDAIIVDASKSTPSTASGSNSFLLSSLSSSELSIYCSSPPNLPTYLAALFLPMSSNPLSTPATLRIIFSVGTCFFLCNLVLLSFLRVLNSSSISESSSFGITNSCELSLISQFVSTPSRSDGSSTPTSTLIFSDWASSSTLILCEFSTHPH